MFGPLIDCWKDGTATMAENERHESEDENSIATPLVLPVREYPNLGDLELSPIDGHTFRAPWLRRWMHTCRL